MKAIIWGGLEGLNNLTNIGGSLTVHYTGSGNLVGLNNLISIGGDLDVTQTCIDSLTGFGNVTSIGGKLRLRHNHFLSNISGLSNIDQASIEELHIYGNDFLSTCHVESICNYLASPNGTIIISNNATGCNSQEEVEAACLIGIPENNTNSSDPAFSIYPNPAGKEISIELNKGMKIKEINIYNQVGQRVLHTKGQNNTIDVSMLGEGIYIIELITEELEYREKLMIR